MSAVEMLRRAPAAGDPAVVQLQVAHQRVSPTEDDTILVGEAVAADHGDNPVQKRPGLHDLPDQPLLADFRLERLEGPAKDIRFDEPDRDHEPTPATAPGLRPPCAPGEIEAAQSRRGGHVSADSN